MWLTEKWEIHQTGRNGASELIRIQEQLFQVAQESQLSRDCAIQKIFIEPQPLCNEEYVHTWEPIVGENDWNASDVLTQLTGQQQSRVHSLNFVKDAISVGIVPLNSFDWSPNSSVEKLTEQPESMRLVSEWNSIEQNT